MTRDNNKHNTRIYANLEMAEHYQTEGWMIVPVRIVPAAKLDALLEAVRDAISVFDWYAELHKQKGQPDADRKSRENTEQANYLRNALAAFEGRAS